MNNLKQTHSYLLHLGRGIKVHSKNKFCVFEEAQITEKTIVLVGFLGVFS